MQESPLVQFSKYLLRIFVSGSIWGKRWRKHRWSARKSPANLPQHLAYRKRQKSRCKAVRHGESSAGNSLHGRNQGISGSEGPASANRLVKAAFLQCRVQGRQHWGDTSSIWDIGSGEMHHGSLIGSSGGQAWGRGCSQLWNHRVTNVRNLNTRKEKASKATLPTWPTNLQAF